MRIAGTVGIQADIRNSTSALETLGDVPVKTKWSDRMSKDVWARLLIPSELAEDERCLYVDADLLCLSGIDQLLEIDLGDNIVGAVRDRLSPGPEMTEYLAATKDPLNTEKNTPYFNSGVLLMDCEKWRQADITPQAIDFAQRNPDLIRFWDQDALNAILRDKWMSIDTKWNTYPLSDLLRTSKGEAMKKALDWSQEDEAQQESIEARAAIIHFISIIKPWLPGYPDLSEHQNRYQRTMQSVHNILNR